MYMSSPSEKMESVVCVVLYLYCVLCVSGRDQILQLSNPSREDSNLIADFGSNVTLVCDTKLFPSMIVAWYKSPLLEALADVSNTNDNCLMNTYRHRRLYKLDCTKTYFRIIIGNIQKEDEGKWYCTGNGGISSQKLNISVNMNVESRMTRITSGTASTRQYSGTTKVRLSTLETVTTNQPEIGEESFMDPPNENLPAVIGGVVGGVIVLVVIVTIVIMVLRRRTHSYLGEKKPNDNDSQDGQHCEVGTFEEDIGGQYAHIGDIKHPTSKSKNPAETSGRLDDGKDGLGKLEAAENPMYEPYEQRDGTVKRSLTSDNDHVPDVYSVVQKPLKSQSITTGDNKDSKSPGADGNGPDVYSVVQKPFKLQSQGTALDDIKDSHPSVPDEVGDVYSVVQKPTKGQKTNGSGTN